MTSLLKRLRKQGLGRATRYLRGKIITASAHVTAGAMLVAHAEILIPLSGQAKEVEAYVMRPVQKRTPVGYNRTFFDSYRPNVSFYLPESIRAELLTHGQAVTTNEPAGTYARRIANRLLIVCPGIPVVWRATLIRCWRQSDCSRWALQRKERVQWNRR